MIRTLLRLAVFLGSAAIGLLVAMLLVDEMTVSWTSFLWVVIIFAVLQSVLAPFIAKVATNKAPALTGAAGLASTLIALMVTAWISGLSISGGPGTWLIVAVIVWLATMIATLLLPALIIDRKIKKARSGNQPA
ncbi:MAG: hypothetical protein GX427_04445 [Actinomycetales bacterium]|nr:hypothetical protein [Actinomycetales bacterium]